jgi:hypothetical protein
MHKYGQASQVGCPKEFGCDHEDQLHLIRCPAPQRREVMEELEADIDKICAAHHIDPHLRCVLLTLADPKWGELTAVFLPLMSTKHSSAFKLLFTTTLCASAVSSRTGLLCNTTFWRLATYPFWRLATYPPATNSKLPPASKRSYCTCSISPTPCGSNATKPFTATMPPLNYSLTSTHVEKFCSLL